MSGISKEDYDKAVAFERQARSEVYLGANQSICGITVADITPHTWAFLNESRTPFIHQGEYTYAHVAQFIAIVNQESISAEIADKVQEWELEDCREEIDEFLELTFLDGPGGTKDDGRAPIASSNAWMEYRFSIDPFRWDYDTKTKHVPFRRLHQLLRCDDFYKGNPVVNSVSGKVESDFTKAVNERMALPVGHPDRITEDMLIEAQERAVYAREGKPYPGYTPRTKPKVVVTTPKKNDDPLTLKGGA